MIDPAKLAAFALVTGLTSLTPGPQMMFVLTQSAWRGARGGAAALAGLQLGNACWFLMAALGLGTLARAFPIAFAALAVAGACYLGWLGLAAIRHAGEGAGNARTGGPSAHAFRDSIAIALSNPKSLVYVTAILPPFVDTRMAVGPQITALAAIAIGLDLLLGAVYVAAGSRLTAALDRPATRARLDRAVGVVFLAIAAAALAATFTADAG